MMECVYCAGIVFVFKQKTAYEMRISDWSSDVCSSDLAARVLLALGPRVREIGSEQWSSGLPDGLAKALARALPQVRWHDISGQKIGRASCRERVGQYV